MSFNELSFCGVAYVIFLVNADHSRWRTTTNMMSIENNDIAMLIIEETYLLNIIKASESIAYGSFHNGSSHTTPPTIHESRACLLLRCYFKRSKERCRRELEAMLPAVSHTCRDC